LFSSLTRPFAPDAVSVRQAEGLPPASFGFHLAMDTLALGYALPAMRACSGLSPIRNVRMLGAPTKSAQGFRLARFDFARD